MMGCNRWQHVVAAHLALYSVHNIACKPCSIEIVRLAAQLDKAVAPVEQLGCDL